MRDFTQPRSKAVSRSAQGVGHGPALGKAFGYNAQVVEVSADSERVGQPDFVITLQISPRLAFFAVNTEAVAAQIAGAPGDELVRRLNVQSIRLASERG